MGRPPCRRRGRDLVLVLVGSQHHGTQVRPRRRRRRPAAPHRRQQGEQCNQVLNVTSRAPAPRGPAEPGPAVDGIEACHVARDGLEHGQGPEDRDDEAGASAVKASTTRARSAAPSPGRRARSTPPGCSRRSARDPVVDVAVEPEGSDAQHATAQRRTPCWLAEAELGDGLERGAFHGVARHRERHGDQQHHDRHGPFEQAVEAVAPRRVGGRARAGGNSMAGLLRVTLGLGTASASGAAEGATVIGRPAAATRLRSAGRRAPGPYAIGEAADRHDGADGGGQGAGSVRYETCSAVSQPS